MLPVIIVASGAVVAIVGGLALALLRTRRDLARLSAEHRELRDDYVRLAVEVESRDRLAEIIYRGTGHEPPRRRGGHLRGVPAIATLATAGAGWVLAKAREHTAITAAVAAATMTGAAVLVMPWDTAPMPGRMLPPDRGIRPDGVQSVAPPPTRTPDGRREPKATVTPLPPGMRVTDAAPTASTAASASPPPSLPPTPTPAGARVGDPTTSPPTPSRPPPVPTSPPPRTPDRPTTDRPPPTPSPDDGPPPPEPDPKPEPEPEPDPKQPPEPRCLIDVDVIVIDLELCR